MASINRHQAAAVVVEGVAHHLAAEVAEVQSLAVEGEAAAVRGSISTVRALVDRLEHAAAEAMERD